MPRKMTPRAAMAQMIEDFRVMDRVEFARAYSVEVDLITGSIYDEVYGRSFPNVGEWAAHVARQEQDFDDFEAIPRGGKTFY